MRPPRSPAAGEGARRALGGMSKPIYAASSKPTPFFVMDRRSGSDRGARRPRPPRGLLHRAVAGDAAYSGSGAPPSTSAVWLRHALDQDYIEHLTLLAFRGARGDDRRRCAVLSHRRDRAEVSFSVADRLQGRGLGSMLARAARRRGGGERHAHVLAHVLPENHVMIDVFRDSGFDVSIRATPGSIDVEFPTSTTTGGDRALRPSTGRGVGERGAAPSCRHPPIAVIGASGDPDSIGGRLFHNLIDGEFHGPVYPVNPKAERGARCAGLRVGPRHPRPGRRRVRGRPGRASRTRRATRPSRRVRGLVVISAGFAETGEATGRPPAGAARGLPRRRGCGWSAPTAWAS